ncbi:MAG: rhamnulokinase, partial [Clostridia bacterium]|nr:rhamnulokinase [Clostridia bacterium]
MKTYLAVDIGASSGRHILGWLEDGKLKLSEVYRFKNGAVPRGGHRCWDIDGLCNSVVKGIAKCTEDEEKENPISVAIDTWGVDFVLLDENLKRIGEAVAYRDSRTEGVPEELDSVICFEELYARTGIQKQTFNSIYQLSALKKEAPEQLEKAEHFLMIPDFLSFHLTGVCANEYTEASTSALLNAEEKTWDTEILDRLEIPTKIFHPLKMAGEPLGGLTETVQKKTGYDLLVRCAPSHDTASAFLAVPAKDENAAFLSSGTWSLLGVELEKPITTKESMAQNFTNEGGYRYRYRYLRNIMGLWMLQSIRRELGETRFDFGTLSMLAKSADSYAGRVDVNDQRFLAPHNMQEAVRLVLKENGFTETPTTAQVLACVY